MSSPMAFWTLHVHSYRGLVPGASHYTGFIERERPYDDSRVYPAPREPRFDVEYALSAEEARHFTREEREDAKVYGDLSDPFVWKKGMTTGRFIDRARLVEEAIALFLEKAAVGDVLVDDHEWLTSTEVAPVMARKES